MTRHRAWGYRCGWFDFSAMLPFHAPLRVKEMLIKCRFHPVQLSFELVVKDLQLLLMHGLLMIYVVASSDICTSVHVYIMARTKMVKKPRPKPPAPRKSLMVKSARGGSIVSWPQLQDQHML